MFAVIFICGNLFLRMAKKIAKTEKIRTPQISRHTVFSNSAFRFTGVRRTTVKEEKKTPQAKEGSTLLTEWRQAFKGQYRAPLRMPTQGEKYKLCPE